MITKAWRQPFRIKSNFARDYAFTIAQAASMGLITTAVERGVWGHTWKLTPAGLTAYWRDRQ